jgi:DNA-binding LytR/AlgR family response regulator
VRVHVGVKTHVLRTTMARMERRVAGRSQFIRIRRSALVNARAITSIDPYGKGMFRLNIRGGGQLVSSRYHQAGLKALLSPD